MTATGRIVWRCWGDGPPLVLLHGDAGSWTHWIRNIPALRQTFRLIVPDMPGYGESDTPQAGWTPASLASSLAEGLRQVVVPSPACAVASSPACAVAGFSFGGIIAGHLAAADRRIDRLVVLGPGGLGLKMHHAARGLRRFQPDMNPDGRLAVHRHNLGALMLAGAVDDVAVSLQVANVAASRLRIGGIPESDSLAAVLPAFQGILAAIWGERDAFAHPEIGARVALLQMLHPAADVRVVDGAGHWVQYEAADRVNAMLTEMVLAPRG